MHYPRFFTALSLSVLFSLGALSSAQAAEPLAVVARAVPAPSLLLKAHLIGQQPSSVTVKAAITLPLRSPAALQELLKNLYTPGNPLFGHYLTVKQFTNEFGPTPSDYQAVVNYVKSQGLAVENSASRTIVGVSGSSAQMAHAFHVQFNQYQMRSGRIAYANAQAPLLPASIAARINGIVGLDNLIIAHTNIVRPPQSLAGITFPGTDSSGGLTPTDIKKIYNLNNIGLEGEGQTLGLVELDGYNSGDINAYVTKFGLPVNPNILYNIYTGGFSGIPGANQSEVVLDIDMMLSLVPRAKRIYVYESPNDNADFLELYAQIASDNFARSISCSFGQADTVLASLGTSSSYSSLMDAENSAFQQMAAQGQSFFAAAGDNGAYDDGSTLSVDNPAQQPYVTAVGGTLLTPSNPGMSSIGYGTESAWGNPAETRPQSPKGLGGGGGYSNYFAKPYYQYSNFSVTSPAGPIGASVGDGRALAGSGVTAAAKPMRDVPDVSLNADPDSGYAIYVGANGVPGLFPNDFFVEGGTSAAAPLWAAFAALVNEARAAGSLYVTPGSDPGSPATPLGFANPLIYEIGFGQYGNYSQDFHDISDFSNNLAYVATPGYDDATGWGSFNGVNLLSAMAAFAPGALSGSGTTGTGTTGGTTVVTGAATLNGASPTGGQTVTITAVSTDGTVTETATTDSTGSYTLSLPTGLTYNFRATASGYLGQSVPNVTLSSSTDTLSFQLTNSTTQVFPSGIQMISEPYDFSATGDDFAGLFGLSTPLTSGSPQLYLWQPQAGSYAAYPNPPADTLRPGIGYWLRVPASDTSGLALQVAGATVSAPFTLPLQQGWNQIGDPFTTPEYLNNIAVALDSTGTGSTVLTSATGLVNPVLYSYSAGATSYTATTSSSALQPYLGYWIYAYKAVYLTFN